MCTPPSCCSLRGSGSPTGLRAAARRRSTASRSSLPCSPASSCTSWATQVSAQVGQAMALVFGLLGLFTNPFLVFIAFFVWIGAAQEASMVQMRTALSGIPVSRAMLTDFHTVAPDDPAKRVLELILAGSQQDFPVVDGGQGGRGGQGGHVAGVLLRSDVRKTL